MTLVALEDYELHDGEPFVYHHTNGNGSNQVGNLIPNNEHCFKGRRLHQFFVIWIICSVLVEKNLADALEDYHPKVDYHQGVGEACELVVCLRVGQRIRKGPSANKDDA